MQIARKITDWLMTAPIHGTGGINVAFGWKFFLVTGLYLASFLVFAQDPFFRLGGAFAYQQGMVTLVLAMILGATFNWELCLFGKPSGANLLLHVIQLFPLSLFIARITAMPSQTVSPESWSGKALELIKTGFSAFLGDVIAMIPSWLTDIFVNWKISLLLVLVLFVLGIRALKLKVAFVSCIFAVAFICALTTGSTAWLLLGTLLLGGGMALQFCRYDRMVYYENVFHRLQKSEQLDSLFTAVTLRAMTALQTTPRLSENNLLSVIRSEYDPRGELSAEDVKVYGQEILRKMIYEYKLVELRNDSQGLYLEADHELFYNDGLLKQIARVPRLVLAVLVAVVWVLLPIDLIPDSIPFIGMLDDVAVTILTGCAFMNSNTDYAKQNHLQ